MSDDYNGPGDGEHGTEGTVGVIDPGAIGDAGEPAGGGRKRRSDAGKPRGPRGTGTGKTKGKTKTSLDLTALTGVFVGVHLMLAQRTPELAISEGEGEEFMKRASAVMSHYGIEAQQKTVDWIAFMVCAGTMYIPRVAAISIRKNEERRQRRGSAQIMPFPGGPALTPEIQPDPNEPHDFAS